LDYTSAPSGKSSKQGVAQGLALQQMSSEFEQWTCH